MYHHNAYLGSSLDYQQMLGTPLGLVLLKWFLL